MSDEFKRGWIMVRRTSQYANRLRSIAFFADGQKVGQLKNGESKAFELSPGEHRVFAKIDWCKTPLLAVRIKPGETIDLALGSEITGWKIFLSAFFLLMPGRLIYLKSL